MQTVQYREMLNEHQKAELEEASHDNDNTSDVTRQGTGVTGRGGEAFQLREDEFEGRAGWTTLRFFLNMGGMHNIAACILFFLVKCVCELMETIQLQVWSTKIMQSTANPLIPLPDP